MKYWTSWKKVPLVRKSAIIIIAAIQLGLMAAALIDIYRRPAIGIRGKKIWWAMGTFIDLFGPLAYFFYGRYSLTHRKDFL